METVITATKSELIEAMHAYNLDSLNNPDDFTDITEDKDDAVIQIENLLEYLVKIRG
tara:strand:+ start:309 stop:479 length:171 start_codon:yes stop_codon:yes gene_type:complete